MGCAIRRRRCPYDCGVPGDICHASVHAGSALCDCICHAGIPKEGIIDASIPQGG